MTDWNDLMAKSVLTLIPAAATWLFSNVLKLRRDMNSAYRKIRAIERELDMSTNEEKG